VPGFFKHHLRLTTSRLSRRIAWWVFICVIIIETIIFIPSFKNRKRELLDQIKAVSMSEVSLMAHLSKSIASNDELLKHVNELMHHYMIIGGTLYDEQGREVGFFGEPPQLSFHEVRHNNHIDQLSGDNCRYDIASSYARPSGDYTLIIRHDTTFVKEELFNFVLRISGLVIIISLFVTIGAWYMLQPIVVLPILRLRKDLLEAGEAISNDRPEPAFSATALQRKDELGDVIAAFRQMYQQISSAVNKRKQAEEALRESFEQLNDYSRALNNELVKGRQIQNDFLPEELPHIPGWDVAAVFKPARKVAGDFYDVFQLPDHNIGFVIADVCDKGVGAALFMALFRSLIRIFSGQALPEELRVKESCTEKQSACPPVTGLLSENPYHLDALKAVQLTNDYIAIHHGSLAMFATLFFGALDTRTGLLTYISGGHEPLLVVSPDGGIKTKLAATGPSVGIQAGMHFEIKQIYLEPGDFLLGYTDGITEASSSTGDFFTRKRLEEMMEERANSAMELVERVAARVTDHIGKGEQFDDITLVAVRRSDR